MTRKTLFILVSIQIFVLILHTTFSVDFYQNTQLSQKFVIQKENLQGPNFHHTSSVQYTDHEPIGIFSNDEFRSAATLEGWPGDGTQSNPFIIENLRISGSSTDMGCININYVDFFFQIRNCYLSEGIFGISLGTVMNGYIFNNTIIGPAPETIDLIWGITLTGSNTIIANNTISYTDIPFEGNGNNYLFISNILFANQNGITTRGNNNVIANNTIQDADPNGIGIFIPVSMNTTVSNNLLYNNFGGIQIENSNYSVITYNTIVDNTGFGISLDLTSAHNLITLNIFRGNGIGSHEAVQASDSGNNNIFTKNFWDEWISPDDNSDGFVDNSYQIGGSANNYDSLPLVSSNQISSLHFLSIPNVLQPIEGTSLTRTTVIEWNHPIDSLDHSIMYSVYYSLDDGITWNLIIADISTVSYTWDTSSIPPGSSIMLKIVATCSNGLTATYISASSFHTPPIDWTLPILIVILLAVISLAVILRQKRESIRKVLVPILGKPDPLTSLSQMNVVSVDALINEIGCSKLELPRKIKETLGKSIENNQLVLRSKMILLVTTPPSNANCQICISKLEGENYFQCEDCQRYTCTPHYVDLKIMGNQVCSNCQGILVSLPFSCKGCQLDFSQVTDHPIKSDRCPLCGYPLPSQNQLIEKRTDTILPSVKATPSKEDYETKGYNPKIPKN